MVHVEGVAQNQRILFPDVTDDQVEDDNPAQFIDAFMDSLGSVGLGFTYAEPDSTGHPPYLAGALNFKQLVKGLEWFIENAKCPGCRQGGGPAWCEVKKCCFEKELRICFECEEFPCSKIRDVADPDTMDRYERFKEIGFEKWVGEQAQKARESYEIHLQKVASLRP